MFEVEFRVLPRGHSRSRPEAVPDPIHNVLQEVLIRVVGQASVPFVRLEWYSYLLHRRWESNWVICIALVNPLQVLYVLTGLCQWGKGGTR